MFTQNQVRQLYVAKDVASGLTNVGDIYLQQPTGQTDIMYFNFVNADGEVMRTDLIEVDKIMSITVTPADKMKYTSKATYVKLSDEVLNADQNPVAGEDYMLNIKLSQNNWPSDQTPSWKYGVVHTTNSTTPESFYKTLAKSLAVNLDKEKLLKVYLTSAAVASGVTSTGVLTEIKPDTNMDNIPSANCKAIVIDEVEQPYAIGKLEQLPVRYEVHSDEVIISGDDIKWGEETEIPGFTVIQNGPKMAELEWFHHGQRGDIYREAAWPTNWPNKMLVDPTQKYDTIDIHYYWNGANHAIQKSEKDITIVCASGVASDIVSDIKDAVPAASGLAYSSGSVSTVILG